VKPATANNQTQASQSVEALIEKGQRSLQQSDLQAAERDIAKALALDPHNAHAFNVLGFVHAACGRIDDAVSHFRAAVAINPEYPNAQANLAKMLGVLAERDRESASLLNDLRLLTLTESANAVNGNERLVPTLINRAKNIGEQLFALKRRGCIDAARVALRLRPDQLLGHINLNNYLSAFGERARLEDYARDLCADQLGKHLFIACFPKSGSTLLKKVLCEATHFGEAHFVSAFGQNEQEIYLPSLLNGARQDLVIQQHCRATGPNLHLLQAFGIRPIILVRNIFDVLLSLKEFFDGGAFVDTFFPNYRLLSEEQRYALVVDDHAPWYISFFAGWQRAVANGQIDGFWLTYGSFIADPRATIEAILKFQGIEVDSTRVARALELLGRKHSDTRFNRGVVGRGSAAFSGAQVEQIRRIAAYHPDVDFSLIGL
jgi:tetratricopeptide (TPR) repeat protein